MGQTAAIAALTILGIVIAIRLHNDNIVVQRKCSTLRVYGIGMRKIGFQTTICPRVIAGSSHQVAGMR